MRRARSNSCCATRTPLASVPHLANSAKISSAVKPGCRLLWFLVSIGLVGQGLDRDLHLASVDLENDIVRRAVDSYVVASTAFQDEPWGTALPRNVVAPHVAVDFGHAVADFARDVPPVTTREKPGLRPFRRCHGSGVLPHGVEADKIDARYRNGVLEVHVPKGEKAKGKRITVKAV